MPEQGVLLHQLTPGPRRVQGDTDYNPIGNWGELRPQPRANLREYLADRVQGLKHPCTPAVVVGPAKSGPRELPPSDGPESQYGAVSSAGICECEAIGGQ